jgi:hypothetical protein
MTNYSFDTLSANEFEILVRDLLQEELGIRLESFKSGRDQGIDLRYAPSKDNSLIVQCKHYVDSGTKKLLYDLEKSESPKVKKLSPKRYIVATSAGLNPSDKEKILQMFPEYLSTKDIYGQDDLNNLLSRYPKVESNHYKLWLSSVHVLETLLKSAVINRTRLDLKRIHNKLKFYVQNVSFTKAKEILDKQHYCIIAGIPGIGKTTLAEALFVDHISQGYEPVRIYGSINEGFEMFKEGVKQVFYFDDFLGTTAFDENSLERNEDKQLLDFLHSVHSNSGEKKLILTSRDYILQQAKQSFESIRYADIKPYLCIINLQNYTRWNKAQILYNHLYFSELSKHRIAELLNERRYLRIIDHPYYSPRVIEWMTQMRRWSESEDDFAETFLKALDNPIDIWKHAFDRDISLAAKYILWVMASLPDRVKIDDLELVFGQFQQYMAEHNRHSIDAMDFHDGLEEIEGTFIAIELLTEQVRIIRFHNPSIRDFLENYLSQHEVVIRFLARSAQFFSQIRWLWGKYEIRIQRPKQLVQIRPQNRSQLLKYADDFIDGLRRTLYSEDISHHRRRYYRLADRIFLLQEISNNMHNEQRLNMLISEAIQTLIINATKGNEASYDLMKLAKSVNRSPYFNDVKDAFLASLYSWNDFERYLIFKSRYGDKLTPKDEEFVRQRLNSRYPGEDLSYVDYISDEAEYTTDDDNDWFRDNFDKEERQNRQRIDPNEKIVDLFDSLKD